MTVEIRALQRSDDRQEFRSGDEALDLYFHRYAGQNQFRHHIGTTYLAVEKNRIRPFEVARITHPVLRAKVQRRWHLKTLWPQH